MDDGWKSLFLIKLKLVELSDRGSIANLVKRSLEGVAEAPEGSRFEPAIVFGSCRRARIGSIRELPARLLENVLPSWRWTLDHSIDLLKPMRSFMLRIRVPERRGKLDGK